MKLNKLFLGAMAFSLLTACSDSDLSDSPKNGPDTETKTENVSGYIAVEIKLPTETATTRADAPNPDDETNDKFHDGTKEEYAVDNAMIILFKGEDGLESDGKGEKYAKFYRAQKLSKLFFTNQPTDDQITSSYLATIPVTVDRDDVNFWALVILNNNEATTGVVGADADGNTTTEVKIAGVPFNNNSTFRDILLQTTTNSFRGADGKTKFFMTNAPLSTVKGGYDANDLPESGNSNIQYLTNLGGKDNIYDNPDEAKKHLSGCVYVERAVAKVTYENEKLDKDAIQLTFVDETGKAYENGEYKVDKVSVEYALTNTNKTSFVVRNVEFATDEKGVTASGNHFNWGLSTRAKDGFSQARMVGSKPMPALDAPYHGEEKAFFRTYWCKDPNYYKAMTTDEKDVFKEDDKHSFSPLNEALYCKENTFVVRHQNNINSTMAVFKINYDIVDKDGKAVDNLFIKDGDYSKVYVSKESAGHDEISRIINDNGIRDALKKSLKVGASTEEYSVGDHLDIKFGRDVDDDGKTVQSLVVKSISLKVPNNDAWFNEDSKKTFAKEIGEPNVENSYQYSLLSQVNSLNVITEYTGGVSYYMIPIMHFGDYYTPWNTDIDRQNEITGTETHEVYNGGNAWTSPSDDHAKKYLGRYGMVRNNWYELSIKEIKALGSPTLPDIDDKQANDINEKKKYFAVEIHLLSWAKRTQKVKF